MKVTRLGWLGIRADNFDTASEFYERVLGLSVLDRSHDFAMFELPGADHDWLELFGRESGDEGAAVYTKGPVPGFVVDDIEQARSEMSKAGVELIGDIGWSKRVEGYGWFHFRGPDGNVFVMLQGTTAISGL